MNKSMEIQVKLFEDLINAVNKNRVEVGTAVTAMQALGALEMVKFELLKEAQGDMILERTSMAKT